MKDMVVIQYEQFFELEDVEHIPEAIREALDMLRGPAGARVIGTYKAKDDKKFRDRAVDSITIDSPVTLRID